MLSCLLAPCDRSRANNVIGGERKRRGDNRQGIQRLKHTIMQALCAQSRGKEWVSAAPTRQACLSKPPVSSTGASAGFHATACQEGQERLLEQEQKIMLYGWQPWLHGSSLLC